MSDQRICDLDGTVIDPASDTFYTVTSATTGARKDICNLCARATPSNLTGWSGQAFFPKKARIAVAGITAWVYEVLQEGTTGSSPPSWPTARRATVADGTVTWIAVRAPKQNAALKLAMPNTTAQKVTLGAWTEGVTEVVQ